ncbi:hypothetical protein FRC08_000694 [Ceratobasidium sp. 394]|nr:hypothetical protein FRC08_000694 [Ceratobasidium sp. 394]
MHVIGWFHVAASTSFLCGKNKCAPPCVPLALGGSFAPERTVAKDTGQDHRALTEPLLLLFALRLRRNVIPSCPDSLQSIVLNYPARLTFAMSPAFAICACIHCSAQESATSSAAPAPSSRA